MNTTNDGSSADFERLLRPYLDRLYRFAFRLTGQKAEAEDLFQDVLTKVYVRLDELDGIREPGTWLNRVLYNQFIDNRRRYNRQRLVVVEEAQMPGQSVESVAGDASPQQDAMRRDNIMRLEAALAQLSDEHRQVLMLHDVEGYKVLEIQSFTGDPTGTIKSRLHRARGRLREILEDDGTFF